MPTLSILIPAYQEEQFIGTVLDRVRRVDLTRFGVDREVIVIDDGSSDGTADIAARAPGVRVERLPAHSGKGTALRHGLRLASGDYVIIQDADLEYDPEDYVPMLQALFEGRGDVVYGSRYLAEGRRANQSVAAYLGGRSLGLVAWLATGRYLTDPATAYKLFRRSDVSAGELRSRGFEIDQEITARLLASGRRIVEVPIRYAPRSRKQGKKIGARDWFLALRTFWRCRRQ